MPFPLLEELPSFLEADIRTYTSLDESPLFPGFYLPPLGDEPFDPLAANLISRSKTPQQEDVGSSLRKASRLTDVVPSIFVDENHLGAEFQGLFADLNWEDSPEHRAILAWEELLPTIARPEAMPLLSETPSTTRLVIAQGPLDTPSSSRTSFVMECLHWLLSGNPSPLFTWNASVDMFEIDRRRLTEQLGGRLAELTHESLMSIMNVFVDTGSLLRRLDALATIERTNSKGSHESHALGHALQIVLAYVREDLISGLTVDKLLNSSLSLLPGRAVLDSLAELCCRDLSVGPPYHPSPRGTVQILDRLYYFTSYHLKTFTSIDTPPIFAYLLSNVPKKWLQELCVRTGIVPDGQTTFRGSIRPSLNTDGLSQDDNGTLDPDAPFELPNFIPIRQRTQITRGIRSLTILRATRPSHPLSNPSMGGSPEQVIGWKWTTDAVEAGLTKLDAHLATVKRQIEFWKKGIHTLQQKKLDIIATTSEVPSTTSDGNQLDDAQTTRKYPPELQSLAKFDVEPLSGSDAMRKSGKTDVDRLRNFVKTFRPSLPTATPTLSQLTQTTVIEPLALHCQLLSSSLLDLYLNDLHFITHLKALRQFMLFGNPNFVAKYRAALFDETCLSEDNDSATGIWRAGLNPKLSSEGEWPPSGYGVGHILRSVVLEPIAEDLERDHKMPLGEAQVWEEAAWRMGFIIRSDDDDDDLEPSKQWSDPTDVQALGFLCLQYRPPPAMDILITSDIIGKYQRVFDFLTSLLRIETLSRSIFLAIRKESYLHGLSQERSVLNVLCRQILVFICSFTSYIFDVAIGSNFNTFVRRLQRMRGSSGAPLDLSISMREDDAEETLLDVFSISDYHSNTLDKILTDCLLKSRHRVARATVNQLFSLVVSLAGVLSYVRDGRMSDAEATLQITRLQSKWNSSMRNLTKILRSMEPGSQGTQASLGPQSTDELSAALLQTIRASDLGFRDLLLRLDTLGYYSQLEGRPSSHR